MRIGDTEVSERLDETMHKAVTGTSLESEIPEEILGNLEVHDSPCPHFVCQLDHNYSRMEQMVKDLSWKLEEHKIHPGCLLVFSSSHCRDVSHPRIIGVSAKKPKFHMFLKVVLEHDRVLLTRSHDAEPEFESSHELFLMLLRLSNSTPDTECSVEVAVWDCNAYLVSQGPTCLLQSNPDSLRCQFIVSSVKRTKKKYEKISLPFGFDKSIKRKRQAAPKKVLGKMVKPKSKAAKAKSQKSPSKCKVGKVKPATPEEISSQDLDNSSESSESSESESCKGEVQEEGDAFPEVEKEEEVIIPMSSTVEKEAKQIAPLAQELNQADTKRAEVAQSVSMAGKAGSYLSTELGLAEVAFAASGRSICMHCKSKIPIHTIRYSWYHSKVRPPAWCHSRCLFQLIQDSGLKSQAVPKLQALIAQHSENHVHNPFAEDAQSILTSLES